MMCLNTAFQPVPDKKPETPEKIENAHEITPSDAEVIFAFLFSRL